MNTRKLINEEEREIAHITPPIIVIAKILVAIIGVGIICFLLWLTK